MGRLVFIQQQGSGLNENIKRWWQGAAAACVAVALAACGGGSSSSDETSVSVRVEGLTASSLTLVDDLGHTVVLSANGAHPFARMAPGTLFTPSIASQPSNQVCRLDAGVRTAARDLELLVRCEAGLLTTSGLRSYVVDQLVMMDTLESGVPGSVTLGGVAVTPLEATTGGFTFRIPELPAGAHELRAVVNSRAFNTVLDISANPLTGDAGEFLRNAAVDAQSRSTELLSDPALTETDKSVLHQLQTELSAIKVDETVAAATAEQRQSLARFLAANDPVALRAAAEALLPPLDDQASAQSSTLRRVTAAAAVDQRKCMRASARFVSAVVIAGASVTSIVATSTEPLGRLLAWYGYVQAVVWVKSQLEVMQEVCGGYVGMLVGSTAVEAPDSTASAARAVSLASGSVAARSTARLRAQASTGLAFNDGESAVLDVVLQKSLSAEVSDRVLAAVARVVAAHRALAAKLSGVLTLPGADLINALATLKRDSTEPARTLQLEAMTAGFLGSIDPVLDSQGQPTGRFTVVFTSSVAPTSDAPILFSFRLRDTSVDYLGPQVNASYQRPRTPVARDLAFETNLDTTLSARLTATHATGFALVTQPSDGTLTLTDPSSGAFTYTPSTGYSGTVAFTYRAFNASATSQTATVVIAVLSDEVSCTLTDNSGSPAGTVSVNRRCYRALLTGADPDEELWIRYVPDLLGDLQFSGRPEDYLSLMEHVYVPVGLSARVSTESASYDPSNNAFTFDKAYGYYNTSDGTAAFPSFTYSAQDDDLRQQTQRLRALLVRNPLSGLLMVDNLQRALVQRAYFADAVVRVDRMEHVSLTLQSLSAGVPTYATTVTRCSRPTSLQSGGYVLTGGADWTVERLTFVNKTETSRTASTSVTCPLSDTTLLDSIAPARGLNNLSFDWRNP